MQLVRLLFLSFLVCACSQTNPSNGSLTTTELLLVNQAIEAMYHDILWIKTPPPPDGIENKSPVTYVRRCPKVHIDPDLYSFSSNGLTEESVKLHPEDLTSYTKPYFKKYERPNDSVANRECILRFSIPNITQDEAQVKVSWHSGKAFASYDLHFKKDEAGVFRHVRTEQSTMN